MGNSWETLGQKLFYNTEENNEIASTPWEIEKDVASKEEKNSLKKTKERETKNLKGSFNKSTVNPREKQRMG